MAAVSGNTSYLLAGDKIGPAKLQKATKLGVKIISESEFMALIGGNDTIPQQPTPIDNAPAPAIPQSEKEVKEEKAPIQGTLF